MCERARNLRLSQCPAKIRLDNGRTRFLELLERDGRIAVGLRTMLEEFDVKPETLGVDILRLSRRDALQRITGSCQLIECGEMHIAVGDAAAENCLTLAFQPRMDQKLPIFVRDADVYAASSARTFKRAFAARTWVRQVARGIYTAAVRTAQTTAECHTRERHHENCPEKQTAFPERKDR